MTLQANFKILHQGAVEMNHSDGYMVVGSEDVVAFYIDPADRGYVCASWEDEEGCPCMSIEDGEDESEFTDVCFYEYPGWHLHSSRGGKTISICLVRREAQKEAA